MEIPEKAPPGALWWCTQCGRISGDRLGKLAVQPGWTQECSENAWLIKEATILVNEDGRVIEADLFD